jgi:hypothetical protein
MSYLPQVPNECTHLNIICSCHSYLRTYAFNS